MIGCETARRLLNERLDGEIAPAEALDLEVHLSGCPDCREVASGLEAVTAGLQRLPLERMPEGDMEAVLARTVGDGASPARSEDRWAWRPGVILSAAAAVLAFALIAPFILRSTAPAEPTTAEVEQASREARMVLAVAARAMRSAETAARDRVIGGEVSPALQHVPVRWGQVASHRSNGA